MNTEITWRPENVEENVEEEMIKSAEGCSAERQRGNAAAEAREAPSGDEDEEYDVHDKLLGSTSQASAVQPPPAISKKKQRQLGPAPIASFEDISDEVRQKVCIAPALTRPLPLSVCVFVAGQYTNVTTLTAVCPPTSLRPLVVSTTWKLPMWEITFARVVWTEEAVNVR